MMNAGLASLAGNARRVEWSQFWDWRSNSSERRTSDHVCRAGLTYKLAVMLSGWRSPWHPGWVGFR